MCASSMAEQMKARGFWNLGIHTGLGATGGAG